MSDQTRYPVESIPAPTLAMWGIPLSVDPRITTETMYLLDAEGHIVGYLGIPAPPPTP